MEQDHNKLKLENQLCFSLYACAKEVVRQYKPYLDPLDLTYTQYITMMVLWEKHEVTAKELGGLLYLDSGTLTPLLKKLEAKGYISRMRDRGDDRILKIRLTRKGNALREQAAAIPKEMARIIPLEPEESAQLNRRLQTVLHHISPEAGPAYGQG